MNRVHEQCPKIDSGTIPSQNGSKIGRVHRVHNPQPACAPLPRTPCAPAEPCCAPPRLPSVLLPCAPRLPVTAPQPASARPPAPARLPMPVRLPRPVRLPPASHARPARSRVCSPLPPERPSARLRLLRAWPCRNAQRRITAPSYARPALAHAVSRPRPSPSSQYSLYCNTNLLPTKLYCNTVSSAAKLPLLQYT